MVQGGYVSQSSTKKLTVKNKSNILDKGSRSTTKSNSNSNNRHKDDDDDSPPPDVSIIKLYEINVKRDLLRNHIFCIGHTRMVASRVWLMN